MVLCVVWWWGGGWGYLLVIRSFTDILWTKSRFVKFGGGGLRPQAEPPTYFTNLLWVWSTSVTDLIPDTDFWCWVYFGLKACRHVTSMLQSDWMLGAEIEHNSIMSPLPWGGWSRKWPLQHCSVVLWWQWLYSWGYGGVAVVMVRHPVWLWPLSFVTLGLQ